MKKEVLAIAMCGLLCNMAYAWGEGRMENWAFPKVTRSTQHKQSQTKNSTAKKNVQSAQADLWNFPQVNFSADYKKGQANIKRNIEKGNVAAVVNEVTKNVNLLYSVDEKGNTPLHLAILKKDLAMVKKLTDKGAPLGVRNNNMQTPLCLAVDMKLSGTVIHLLQHKNMNKKIVNATCSKNQTAFEKAKVLMRQSKEVKDAFIKAGANTSAKR
ncbi:MAG: ankyrin repeat domain-containing protein [Elusimicrobiaceae bacterium]|nr:ankyrin repeat domain-containing protein [Elusimicrobiaceae bacterium]